MHFVAAFVFAFGPRTTSRRLAGNDGSSGAFLDIRHKAIGMALSILLAFDIYANLDIEIGIVAVLVAVVATFVFSSVSSATTSSKAGSGGEDGIFSVIHFVILDLAWILRHSSFHICIDAGRIFVRILPNLPVVAVVSIATICNMESIGPIHRISNHDSPIGGIVFFVHNYFYCHYCCYCCYHHQNLGSFVAVVLSIPCIFEPSISIVVHIIGRVSSWFLEFLSIILPHFFLLLAHFLLFYHYHCCCCFDRAVFHSSK